MPERYSPTNKGYMRLESPPLRGQRATNMQQVKFQDPSFLYSHGEQNQVVPVALRVHGREWLGSLGYNMLWGGSVGMFDL